MVRSGSGWGCEEDGAEPKFDEAEDKFANEFRKNNFTRQNCTYTSWTGDGLHQIGPAKTEIKETDIVKMVQTIKTAIDGQLDTKTLNNYTAPEPAPVPEPEPEPIVVTGRDLALSMTEAQKCGEDATEPYDCPWLLPWNEKADCCAVLGGARPLPVKYGRSLAPGASPLITVQ
jgi:hypothetical protein